MGKMRRRSEADRLRMIIGMQGLINAVALDLDEVMRVVTERAQAVTGADGGVVEMVDGAEMVYRAVSGSAAGSFGVRLRRAGSLSGLCVSERAPLRCDDAEVDPRVDREVCRRVGVRSMIVVPLFHGYDTVGVLKVLSGRPGHFHDEDLADLELMAQFIADAMSNAAVHHERDHQALHDPLTGLPNRSLLGDRLGQALRQSSRTGAQLAVLFLDLDGFKSVNDTLGHPAGDRVLEAVAAALGRTVRASDTLARVGGDEFVVVCPEADDAVIDSVTMRLQAAVNEVARRLDHPALGVSIGVVRAQGTSTCVDEVLAAADAEMYRVKRDRRDGQVAVRPVGVGPVGAGPVGAGQAGGVAARA